jgi:parvulin-like peptidyl-prolyl isomerase
MKKLVLGSLLVVSSLFAGDILAVVNGVKITKDDINILLAPKKLTYDQLPPQYQKQFLDKMIIDKLLMQKAQTSGIEKSELYQEELKKLKKRLALSVFLKEKIDSFDITQKEMKEFYNKNRDLMFKNQPQVKARHILVKTQEEAKSLINQLSKVPQTKLEEKFIELAEKYSTGPSGKNGGELGWFSESKMIPAFSKVAFSLKKGSISLTPVKTRFGYHIIYVEDKKDGGYIPFDDVQEKIRHQLQLKKFGEYIKLLKSQAKIEYK